MFNYLKSEFYRNFNRMYYWVSIFILSCICILVNLIIRKNNCNLMSLLGIIKELFMIGIFLTTLFIEISSLEEKRNHTFKNTISFGISRNKLILYKNIEASILGIIALVVILSSLLGSAVLIGGLKKGFSINSINDFMIRLLVAIILWIACVAIGNFIMLITKSDFAFGIGYSFIFVFTSKIIQLISVFVYKKITYINEFLITTQFKVISKVPITSMKFKLAFLIGIIYIIVFTILSILVIKKQEIR